MDVIRSATNPLAKRVRAVRAGRGGQDFVLLEGDRLLDEALAQGLEFELVLVGEDRAGRADELVSRGLEPRLVEAGLLQRLSGLSTSPGVLALVRPPRKPALAELEAAPDALWVVSCGLQDPGNLGALARTAEAAGATALATLAAGCSPFHPRALRGSMGSLLRLATVVRDGAEELVDELAARGFRNVRAATRGGRSPRTFDWSGRIALWISSERGGFDGLSEARVEALEAVTIPLAPGVESLNATAAAAVLCFAAGRNESREAGA